MQLKYLLQIEFIDGTLWSGGPEDTSRIDGTRSSFYDLLQIDKKIKRAWLEGNKGLNTLGVNLLTGTFSINGVDFQIDQDQFPPMQRELIFFREHTHNTNVTYKSGIIQDHKEIGHSTKYFLGWKVNVGGKEYKQIVGIS